MFTCGYCNHGFPSWHERAVHHRQFPHHRPAIDGKYRCRRLCGESFDSREALMSHIMQTIFHDDLNRYVIFTDGREMARCSSCKCKFDDFDGLIRHLSLQTSHYRMSTEDFHRRQAHVDSMREEIILEQGLVDQGQVLLHQQLQEEPQRVQVLGNTQNIPLAAIDAVIDVAIDAARDAAVVTRPTTPVVSAAQPATNHCAQPELVTAAMLPSPNSANANPASTGRKILAPCSIASRLPISGPPTLQEELQNMAAKLEAANSQIAKYHGMLEHQVSLRQCVLCYERDVDTVVQCGHQYCNKCVTNWQDECKGTWDAPCPMCRRPMGFPVKVFRSEASL